MQCAKTKYIKIFRKCQFFALLWQPCYYIILYIFIFEMKKLIVNILQLLSRSQTGSSWIHSPSSVLYVVLSLYGEN